MLDGNIHIEFGRDDLLAAFCTGFNIGFADYKYGVQMDEPQMVKFLARSGIDLEQSAVLLQRNGAGWHGAGVALVALVDGEAWCSGLAVAPALRSGGLGRRLMEAIQARAAAAGARTLRLEVLVHNTPARRLYEALGYQPVRDLLFWRAEPSPIQPLAPPLALPLAPLAYVGELYAANVEDALIGASDWQTTPPAWQRTPHAVELHREELWAFRMQNGSETTGWAICLPTASPQPGQPRLRIMTLAVQPGAQQALLARQLLAGLRAHYPEAVFSLINEPEQSVFTQALPPSGFFEVDRQIEMALRLRDKEEIVYKD